VKLKTMMARECDEWFPLFDGEGDAMPAFEHDAAYAHALVMAMEEFRPKVGYAMWEFAIPMITNRADELMREWGYS
jgi:hypothetical protein